MQIGLAKTPTMHGGIASVKVGLLLFVLFFTTLSFTHAYA